MSQHPLVPANSETPVVSAPTTEGLVVSSPAPAQGITTATSTPKKTSCLCGCTGGINLPWQTPAQSRASPQFKQKIEDGVKELMQKAEHLKTNRRQEYIHSLSQTRQSVSQSY
jgi:hypothetical protein